MKFTFDVENREQLPFLDVLVTRNNNKLEFDIFKKIPAFRGTFLTILTIANNTIWPA